MTFVWSFIRQYLTESEAWLLLPVLAAVSMAIASFFLLQSAVDKRATVTAAEKANWRSQLLEQGKQVYERAKQKAEADAAAMRRNQGDKQLPNNSSSSKQPQPPTGEEAPTAPSSELRQRKGKEAVKAKQTEEQEQSAAVDDSGLASDNDWELVDDERIERAEENEYEPPLEYQQAVEAFIEALHELPTSAVDELQGAVKQFFSVLCSLLDGSSHITPLPSTRSNTEPVAPPPSSPLSSSDRYATRNVLLSRLVDTQSLHALHQLVEEHPGTPLAADAEHLHQLLVPVLHSH